MSSDVLVPPAAIDANKYSRGKLVVIAGSGRYPGAAVLAARAAQRTGAGYTEVVTAAPAVDIVRLSSPSLVVRSLDQWDIDDLPRMRGGRPCAVCLGPGFVPDEHGSRELTMSVLKAARCPVVVDGGALAGLTSKNAVKRLAKRAEKGGPTVVTPHGGEAARLAEGLGIAAGADELARALHAIVVLKGPDTFISDGNRTVAMRKGTSALAKAGTGDVLAGIVGALLAQGIDPFEAAVAGTTLHARAGNAAAARLGSVSVIAEDVIDCIPAALGY